MTSVTRRTRAPVLPWVVLLLVAGSFGFVAVALVSARTSWAWGSVAAAGVAGGLLVGDWVAVRRAPAVTGPPAGRAPGYGDGVVDDADPLSASRQGDVARPRPGRSRAADPREFGLSDGVTLDGHGVDPAITGEPPEERASRPQ